MKFKLWYIYPSNITPPKTVNSPQMSIYTRRWPFQHTSIEITCKRNSNVNYARNLKLLWFSYRPLSLDWIAMGTVNSGSSTSLVDEPPHIINSRMSHWTDLFSSIISNLRIILLQFFQIELPQDMEEIAKQSKTFHHFDRSWNNVISNQRKILEGLSLRPYILHIIQNDIVP